MESIADSFKYSNNIILIFNFVVTPRNFIIAKLSISISLKFYYSKTTKLNIIFFHHANFQGINIILIFSYERRNLCNPEHNFNPNQTNDPVYGLVCPHDPIQFLYLPLYKTEGQFKRSQFKQILNSSQCLPTSSNIVFKQGQHVASNNVG